MTNNGRANRFSAVDAKLGYLYQLRLALFCALRRLKSESDFLVSVETLDDVMFERTDGEVMDLLQTKHHRKGIASLTNASPDIWKTLRIWFEGHASGQIPQHTDLYLITTSVASENTAACKLRLVDRDVKTAQKILDATATSSKNMSNKSSYEAYLNLTPSKRTEILDKVVVIDAAPNISELDNKLYQEIYWAAEKEHHEAFLQRLEGWWLRCMLRQLIDTDYNRLSSSDIEKKMFDLSEQFKQDALPIDDDLLDFILDDATKANHQDFTFVSQLQIIKAGKHRIAPAIRDYYRAFEQRSRWIREDLIVNSELYKYEKHLQEEWELIFEAMRDELGDTATNQAKEKAARLVLAWAERTTIPIRSNVTEPFVSRGSLHMLADNMRIGWHPEFRERLASLLNPKEGSG